MTQILQGERYKSAVLTIPRFDVHVRALALNRKVYFPVRAVCIVLGLDHRTQRARLQSDSRFAGATRDVPVLTSQGYRDTVCIRKEMVGAWLTLVDPHHCKLARTRERLQEFQSDLFAAADRFLFGDTSRPDAEASISTMVSGILHVGPCPGCGMALCLILDSTGAHLAPDGEE